MTRTLRRVLAGAALSTLLFTTIGTAVAVAANPPTITNLAVSPSPTNAPPTISATANGNSTSSQRVSAWEYYIGATAPANGAGTVTTVSPAATTVNINYTLPTTVFNPLADGTYTVWVNAKNTVTIGSQWGTFVSTTFVKDTTGPTVTNLSVTPSPTSTVPAITATVSDANAVSYAEYFIGAPGDAGDGYYVGVTGSTASGDLSAVFAGLPDGTTTVYLHALDLAGNWGGFASTTFVKDSGPVVSPLTVLPSPTNAAPTITATATDAANTVVAAEYFVDSATATPGTGTALTLSSTGTNTWTYTGSVATFASLSQGTHTVYVDAKDSVGVWGAKASQTFMKDTVGPVVPVFTVTPTVTNSPPTITVNNLTDVGGVAAAEYFVDNATGVAGTGTPLTVTPLNGTPVTATGTLTPATFSSLAEGTHTISVDAQDNAGNWSAAKRSVTFTKDSQPPVVTVLTASPTTGTPTSPLFSITITDNRSIAGAEYFIDAAGTPGTGTGISVSGTTTASTSFFIASFASLSDGPHTLIAEARDGAGNWSATNSVGFIKDAQIPTVQLAAPASPTSVQPLNFTATFSVPVTLADASKIVATGGTAGAPTSDITGTIWTIAVTPAAIPSPQAGESVTLQLLAGAFQSASLNYASQYVPSQASFTVSATFDNVAPVLTGGAFWPGSGTAPFPVGTVLPPGVYTFLYLTFNENVVPTPQSSALQVHLNNGTTLNFYGYGGFSQDHTTLIFSTTTQAGQDSHGVALDLVSSTPFTGGSIADAAGNGAVIPTPNPSDPIASQNITQIPTDTVPPVTTIATVNNNYGAISPNAAGWFATSPVYFTLSATDLGSGVAHMYYIVDGGAQGTYLSTHVAVTGNGTHTVVYWSVDNAGNIETAKTLTIKIDTSQPVITLNQPPNGTYGVPYTITGTWSEPISGLSTTSPFTVYLYDFVDNYSYITVGSVTSPSFVVNGNGTWSYTFIPTTAVWGNSVPYPIEGSNWVISMSATSGAGVGSNGASSHSGGNVKYTSAPTAVFTGTPGGGAAGTGILTNGFVTGVSITNGGSGYSQASPPVVTFTGGGGFNAQGTAIVNGAGQVTGVDMTMITFGKQTPTINWSNPADIIYPTALSGTQLNATAVDASSNPVAGTFTYTPPSGTVLSPGAHQALSVTFTPTDTTNFATASATVYINVTQLTLTITASSATVTYGDPAPAITPGYSGFQPGDNPGNSLSTLPTCSTAYVQYSGVAGSPYTTSCSGAVSSKYAIAYVNGTVTVGKAPLTITASSATVTYGDPAPTVTPSYSGFLDSDNAGNSLSTLPTCSTTYSQGSGVSGSPYSASCSGAVSANYSIAYVNGSVTVGTASLTITASSATVTFGDAAPTIHPSYSGFIPGDNAGNSLSPAPTCSTTYTQGSPVSGSPYSTSCSGAGSTNYSLSYVSGSVTVGISSTTTTVTTPYDPTQFGRTTVFTATVVAGNPGAGTPTGNVQWVLDGSPAGSPVPLNGSGKATFSSNTLGIGTHTLTANYLGTSNFAASSGTFSPSVVKRLATTSVVTSNVNPSVFGSDVIYTATITPQNLSSGQPVTGSVTWQVDGVPTGATSPLSGGVATVHMNNVPAGTHNIRAVYGGDTNFTASGSTGTPYSQVVKKATPTGAVLTVPATPFPFGTKPIITATFTNPAAPLGSLAPATVQFQIDGTAIDGPIALAGTPTGGTASYTLPYNLPLGTHTIRAQYQGNANFVAVLSSIYTVTITP